MSSAQEELERLEELSMADALGELTPEERSEYAALRSRRPDFDPQSGERVVGAALDALHCAKEPLPREIAAKIISSGRRYLVKPPRAPRREYAPLWFAAAATLLLAAGIWVGRSGSLWEGSIAEQRSELLASGRPLVRAEWSPGGDLSGTATRGDVVWDPQTQSGFMRFQGLRPNSAREQYQLWIFDRTRDERYPVDGGVFDVRGTGEVVVAIRAKLHVETPMLFAVTVEKPGGVVVSSRDRIAVIAKTS